jgi:hypothetical protein
VLDVAFSMVVLARIYARDDNGHLYCWLAYVNAAPRMRGRDRS